MSDAKRAQLIADGRLREDGSRIERCPTCLREFGPGEHMPDADGSAIAEAAEHVAAQVDPNGAES